MPLSTDEILAQADDINLPVLLSEQSLLAFILAIDYIDNRSAWDDMSDADWNVIEGILADATTQILTEDESGGGGVSIETKNVARSSIFTVTGTQNDYPLDWNVGDYDSSDNSRVYIENTGRFIITLNLDFDSAGAFFIRPDLYHNTTKVAGFIGSNAANRAISLSVTLDMTAGDYIQIKLNTNGTASVAVSDWASRMNITGFY